MRRSEPCRNWGISEVKVFQLHGEDITGLVRMDLMIS